MATNCTDYEPSRIEAHWREYWDRNGTFRAPDNSDKPKYYVLDMFPYPSGAGLHIGHPEGYTASDILSRYKRGRGFNVLHPMGWDAFGLPTEQYAIKTGTHPSETNARNIVNFRAQIKRLGFSYDWSREIDTTDPGYYRWTQWIFLQLFKRGLAYVDERPVWWCPELKTVLANEEVIDGRSERGDHPVERRNLRQWVLRITAYADRLLEDLKSLDWPDSTKRQQEAWIGRSEGAEIEFPVADTENETLKVFTTRPDTLFGATYMVVAPEHPAVRNIVTPEYREAVDRYVRQATQKSDLERTDLAKEKSGVFTGAHAINPINESRIPIWVADYVLISYGTGAIMAVPAHDERDYEFATTFDIPVIQVIQNPGAPAEERDQPPYTGPGKLINSGSFSALDSDEAARRITERLAEEGRGRATVQYRLRDWLFSRQRFWGEPFPVVWIPEEDYDRLEPHLRPEQPVHYRSEGRGWYAAALDESQLPLELPEVESYQPSGTGESPLANESAWVDVWYDTRTGATIAATEPKPDGDRWISARRETNTMPQWAGSCWYHLRYLDPHNDQAPVDPKLFEYWGTPDYYIGGAEHAVLHLLYARFWHKFLHDIGVVTDPEPFKKLFHQGIILGEDGEKMSKSRGNVVNPDSVIEEHGADSLRAYLMFLGPLEAMKPWKSQGIEGIVRFLKKVWREVIDREGNRQGKIVDGEETDSQTLRLLHETIKKVGEDIEALRLNTAISQMMIFVNHIQKTDTVSLDTARTLVRLLAPFAPHLAEELWERLGGSPSVDHAPWPEYDPARLESETVKVVFQVNGKFRGDALVAKSADQDAVLATAREQDRVAAHLDGKNIRKVIYVPGKILNIVAT